MMRRYAVVRDNWVDEIVFCETKDEVRSHSATALVLDVEEQPDVTIGWFFAQNKLVSPDSPEANLYVEEQIARNHIKPAGDFGTELVKIVRDKIGARNIRLGVTEQQISSLVSNLATVKMLCEGSALKTARSLITYIKPNYPQYDDILQFIIDQITENVK